MDPVAKRAPGSSETSGGSGDIPGLGKQRRRDLLSVDRVAARHISPEPSFRHRRRLGCRLCGTEYRSLVEEVVQSRLIHHPPLILDDQALEEVHELAHIPRPLV